MTMRKIYGKLRRHSFKNYLLLVFCLILSVVLVCSYAVMYLSPTVQSILPKGGDSNFQATLILSLAVLGCAIFTTYASSIFFRYKSRETGVLLSLGMQKKLLKRTLFGELALITTLCCLVGLLISIPLSYGIWRLFQLAVVDTREMAYQFSPLGLLFGGAFCIFVTLCIFFMAARFIRRTNLMELLNDRSTAEPVPEPKAFLFPTGLLLTVLGLVLGYVVPLFTARVLFFHMPGIWNLTYLLSLAGIYLVLTHAVTHAKKGKNPRRYYKHLISTSMLRFTGRQTVRSMCVMAFLIAGALFAAFYMPASLGGTYFSPDDGSADYIFHTPAAEPILSEELIRSLAEKHRVTLTSYEELPYLLLVTNGKEEIWEENGAIRFVSYDQYNCSIFYRASDFSRATGVSVNPAPGTCVGIRQEADRTDSSLFEIALLSNPDTEESMPMTCTDTVLCPTAVFSSSFGAYTCYVLSDADYDAFDADLSVTYRELLTFFDVEHPEDTYAFAKELKDTLITRMPSSYGYPAYYDFYMKQKAEENGEDYFADSDFQELSTDNNQLATYWKYYPAISVLQKQDMIKNAAVFLMLFLYISLICFAAVGIIAYTRSLTIALNHGQVFQDLKRLGASNRYIRGCIRTQLNKIFLLPYLLGGGLVLLFFALILYNNDGRFQYAEAVSLLICVGLTLLAGVYLLFLFWIAYGKIRRMLEI